MATDIDRKAFLKSLEKSLTEKDKAAKLGKELAAQGIKRIFLVGCGAPNREMGAIKYWMDRDLKEIETHLYFPAEFTNQSPAKVRQRLSGCAGVAFWDNPRNYCRSRIFERLPL